MTEHARLCYVLNEVLSWEPCALLWRRLGWQKVLIKFVTLGLKTNFCDPIWWDHVTNNTLLFTLLPKLLNSTELLQKAALILRKSSLGLGCRSVLLSSGRTSQGKRASQGLAVSLHHALHRSESIYQVTEVPRDFLWGKKGEDLIFQALGTETIFITSLPRVSNRNQSPSLKWI